ncbi:hypothetical protein CK224_19175 [Mesorhizobium sp. WSM3862]|nr:hypothetical protein CK224_19175 [Mesorhizobium sp. WSM3862]
MLVIVSMLLGAAAQAQEEGPSIIPERLQQIALKTPLADRLHVNWESASPTEIGEYMGLLAAINQASIAIALKNGRDAPSDSDYMAGFAAWCLFPNKPPIAEPFWPRAYGAFGSAKVRSEIRNAVRPLAVQLPSYIDKDEAREVVEKKWPQDPKAYFSDVLDLGSLSDVK